MMNFKNILETLDQLSEGVKEKEGGRVHTAEPGGYGRKFDTDEEGDEKKKDAAPAAKRGRGRPKKGADDSGEVKKYDNAKNLQDFMIGNKPKKSKELDKLPSKKNTLKDWFERIDEKYLAEAEQVTLEPAKQNTQVIKKGTQTIGTVTNPALAATIKSAIGKGEMNLAGQELGEADEDYSAKKARAGKDIGKPGKNFAKIAKKAGEKYGSKERGEKVAGAVLSKLRSKTNEAERPSDDSDMGAGLGAARSMTTLEGKKPDFLDLDKDGNKKESMKKAAQDKKKVKEGMNHKLQAARLEGKAHGLKGHAYNGKAYDDLEEARAYHEGFKEGIDECYGMKPIQGMVDEMNAPATVPGMASQEEEMATMEAEMEEGKFKDNLKKAALGAVVAGNLATGGVMAKKAYDYHKTDPAIGMSQADLERDRNASFFKEDDMEEGNAFTAALARTPNGGKFKVGGKTFTDRSSHDAKIDEYAFESLDRELQRLLTEGEEKIEEGLTVSISKGQQGAPDSVTVSAQDSEADQLLGLIKQAGLGLFGDEQHSDYGAPAGSSEVNAPGGIEVVGDHDGMMGIMKKLSGIEQSGASDYADEEGEEDCGCGDEETSEAACNECGGMGMHESGCSAGGKEMVDEVETEDQMMAQVAEQGPDSGAEDSVADENAEAAEDSALAKSDMQNKTDTFNEGGDGGEASEEADVETDADAGEEMDASEEEEELNEWANNAGDKGTDAAFERDIEFMTKVISGGLNKPKSTGQTTAPVIASQLNRQHSHQTTDINESITDWKKLAGIK